MTKSKKLRKTGKQIKIDPVQIPLPKKTIIYYEIIMKEKK